MKGVINQTQKSKDYEFYLSPLDSNKKGLTLSYDFSPITCPKTFKSISLVPTYYPHLALPFQTELDLPNSSLRIEAQETFKAPQMLVAKPSTQYCQICKEKFEDYLKHSSHPLHINKVKELHNDLNFNFLQEVMKKKSAKKSPTKSNKTIESEQQNTKKRSQNYENLSRLKGKYTGGYKKRIIENEDGDIQVISIASITKGTQLDSELCELAQINTKVVSVASQYEN